MGADGHAEEGGRPRTVSCTSRGCRAINFCNISSVEVHRRLIYGDDES